MSTAQGVTYNGAAAPLLVNTFDNALNPCTLHLFVSDSTPAVTDNPSVDYTEAFGPNYAPIDLTFLLAQLQLSPPLFGFLNLLFSNVGPLTPGSDTVFGWWIDQTTTGSPSPLFGGRFASPIVLNMAGQSLALDVVELPLHDCGVSIPLQTITLLDLFEQPTPGALTAHTPLIGGPWAFQTGSWTVGNRTATPVAVNGSGFAAAGVDTAAKNGYISADVTTGTSSAGVAFRILDASNMYWAEANTAGGQFSLGRWQGAVFTQLAFATVTIPHGSTNRIDVILADDTITAIYNGTQTISFHPASFNDTCTVHGLWDFALSGQSVRSILFTPAVPSNP